MGISEDRKKAVDMKALEQAEAIFHAQDLKDRGYTNVQIAEAMNIPESTVRAWVK